MKENDGVRMSGSCERSRGGGIGVAAADTHVRARERGCVFMFWSTNANLGILLCCVVHVYSNHLVTKRERRESSVVTSASTRLASRTSC